MPESFVYRGSSKQHDAAGTLSREWLLQHLRCVNEATFVTAYWDGDFIQKLLNGDVGKLRKLTVAVHSRDYFGKKTLLRDKFVGAEDLKDVGIAECEVRLVDAREGIFHAKVFVFGAIDEPEEMWIGSANATRNAFEKNTEVLMRAESNSINGLTKWVKEVVKASKVAEHQRGTQLEHLIMAGYLWVDSPKIGRQFGVSLKNIDGFQPPKNASNDTPGSLEHNDATYTMSVPRVIELCDDQVAKKVADAFKTTGIISEKGSVNSGGFWVTPLTVWSPIGFWAVPKDNDELEMKKDNVPSESGIAWKVIEKNLEDVLQSDGYKATKSKQVRDIAIYGSLDKAQANILDKRLAQVEKRFSHICLTPVKRQKLTRLLVNQPVPNLHALRDSDPIYVDWIIDCWVGSLIERGCEKRGNAAKRLIGAFGIAEEWKKIYSDWMECDVDSAEEVVLQARELIANAWADRKGYLPKILCKNEQGDAIVDICRLNDIKGTIDSDPWKQSVKQLLGKIHQNPRDSDHTVTEWVEAWEDGLELLVEHGVDFRQGAWCVPIWPLSSNDYWWFEEGQWQGWVWCSGVPIFDPPHDGFEKQYGDRLPKEQWDNEDLIPPWELDHVDYAMLGGMDLRTDIPRVLDQYRQSKAMDSDIKMVKKWILNSELRKEEENDRYQQMKRVGYSKLKNEYRAFWRRRITADECGELIVAPLGKPYMNLWGEPCCCGRQLKYPPKDKEIIFHNCRLCQTNPNP